MLENGVSCQSVAKIMAEQCPPGIFEFGGKMWYKSASGKKMPLVILVNLLQKVSGAKLV